MVKYLLVYVFMIAACFQSQAQVNWIYSNDYIITADYNPQICDTTLFRMVNDSLQIGFYFPYVAASCPTEYKYSPIVNDSMRVRFSWVQNPSCNFDEPSWCVTLNLFHCDSFNTMKVWLNNSLDYNDSLNGTWYQIAKNPNCTITAGFAVEISKLKWDIHSSGLTTTVNWSTIDDLNISHFEIQKSFDGKIFETFASLNSKGNGAHSYHAIDERVPVHLLYRIKTIDRDGKIAYSSTKSAIPANDLANISVFPNPANTFYNIHLYKLENSELRLTLHDLTGRIVDLHTLNISTPDYYYKREIAEHIKGLYILQIHNADDIKLLSYPLMIE